MNDLTENDREMMREAIQRVADAYGALRGLLEEGAPPEVWREVQGTLGDSLADVLERGE